MLGLSSSNNSIRTTSRWSIVNIIRRKFAGITVYRKGLFEENFKDDLRLVSLYRTGRYTEVYDKLLQAKTDTEESESRYPIIIHGYM